MKRLVIVVNGKGGVGKDTLCSIASKYFDTMTISSIDPIKKIALTNGWDGKKDLKSRKFLSDLKELFTEFNNLSQNYLLQKYDEFVNSRRDILFVHIREPKDIEKFNTEILKKGDTCLTLLVKSDRILENYGNVADDNVEDYNYDIIYDNNISLEETEVEFIKLMNKLFKKYDKDKQIDII